MFLQLTQLLLGEADRYTRCHTLCLIRRKLIFLALRPWLNCADPQIFNAFEGPSKVSILYASLARPLAYMILSLILSLTSSSVRAGSRCLMPSAQTRIQASIMPIARFTLSSGFSSPADNGATPEPGCQLRPLQQKRLFASFTGHMPISRPSPR